MNNLLLKAEHFWSELKRRKTIRTAVAYLIILAAIVGPASDILGGLGAPDWMLQSVIIILIAGFPVVLILSWIFDITRHGIERTKNLDENESSNNEQEEDTDEDQGTTPGKSVFGLDVGSAQKHQITVLRCSFSLSENGSVIDDPELLMDSMPSIERLMSNLNERYSATELSHDGSTFELIFGYPIAYENDSIRAVANALAIIEDLQGIAVGSSAHAKVGLSARISIVSNEVVIDTNADIESPLKIIGNALQSASWLQGLASLNNVLLDGETFQLLRNRFSCESLGEKTNEQSQETFNIYRAMELRESQFDILEQQGRDSVFLGRESEIALIADRWDRAIDGEDEFIVLKGDAGIGKSTIVRETINAAEENESAVIMSMFCSPLEQNSALQPIIEYMMGPGLGLTRKSSEEEKVERIKEALTGSGVDEERAVPLIASLLSFEAGENNTTVNSEATRTELFQYLIDLFKGIAKENPFLLVVEDLHWADPSTLELLAMLIGGGSKSGMLCLLTTRPSKSFEWESRSSVTVLSLQGLSRRSTRELVSHIFQDQSFPEDFVKRIVSETDGNPLFAEELAKAVYETASAEGDNELTNLVLPGSLQRSLASRIDHLGDAKLLVQVCSMLGREFNYELLKKVSQVVDEQSLKEELKLLVHAEFLYQNGTPPQSTYIFKHILMQETAYQSMLRSTRRQLHNRVAQALIDLDPNAPMHQPEVLAFHYEESGQPELACQYWLAASSQALSSAALIEASELASKGLEIAETLPDSDDKNQLEISLLGVKGRALLTSKGYADPEVEATFGKALALSGNVEDSPQAFTLLVGMWAYFQIAGSADDALKLSGQLMENANQEPNPAKKVQALYCLGYTNYRKGKLADAAASLDAALIETQTNEVDYSMYSPTGDDLRVQVRCILAHVKWQQGEDETSKRLMDEALELSETVGSQFGIVFALFLNVWLSQLQRNTEKSIERANQSLEIAQKYDLNFFIPNSLYAKTWAEFHRHESTPKPDELIESLITYVEGFKAIGARFGVFGMSLDIAEALAINKRVQEAEEWVEKAIEIRAITDDEFLMSELHRVKAEIELAKQNPIEAVREWEAAAVTAIEYKSIGQLRRTRNDLENFYRSQGDDAKADEVQEIFIEECNQLRK